MRLRPVAVALPFLSKFRSALILLGLLLASMLSPASLAESGISAESLAQAPGYLARIQQNSPQEVEQALLRAEKLYVDGELPEGLPPLAFVLHGPEVEIFFRGKYKEFKSIVDLAARLSAFGVIDVAVCRTRMGVLGQDPAVLYPFVSTVPFGPAEVNRVLNEEQYVYF